MKKIYLLSAAACLFAFSANAQKGYNEWFASGGATDGSTFTLEQVSGTQATAGPVAKVVVSEAGAAGDPWAVQFCNILHEAAKGQAEGNAIKIEFEALYAGDSEEGMSLSFLTGKMPDNADLKLHDDYQWADGNTEITDVEGANNQCINKAFPVGKEWTKITVEGTIGAAGATCIGIQMNLGGNAANAGTFFFKNFTVTMKKDVLEFFKDEAPLAIADDAAIKAYVANNVIYASEAVDVVVYNISGVAVKAAKNVNTLNVSDLKAGLYVAKVGNATVKFVK